MKSISFITKPNEDISPIVQGFNKSSLVERFTLKIGFDFYNPIDSSTQLIVCSKTLLFDDYPNHSEWSPVWSPKTSFRGIPLIFISDEDEFLKNLIIRAVDFKLKPKTIDEYCHFFNNLKLDNLESSNVDERLLQTAS